MNLNKKITIDIDSQGATAGARTTTEALKQIDAQARKTGGGLDVLDQGGGKAAESMSLAGTAAKAFGGVLAGISVASFAKSIFDAGVAMDSMERSFVAITGNSTAASAEMFFLRDEADRLGQSFYDLAPQFKQIAASARGTALEGEQTRKIFSAITEASTALGLSSDETSGALNALSQMISKGTVQAEELRGQLGERLPGAFQLAARAMGVSTQELGKMLEQGQVLATDLLPKLAEELHKTYGAAAETAGVESARAAVNRLSEAWTDFKVNLFYSEPAVVGINAVTAALKEMSDEANSLSRIRQDMFGIGETMSSSQFLAADREERLKMLNLGGENTYRGKVNRDMVMPAYVAPAAASSGTGSGGAAEAKKYASALAEVQNELAKMTMTAAEYQQYQFSLEYEKMAKALGSANPELQKLVALKAQETKYAAIAAKQNRPENVARFEQMNRGDMFWGKDAADKRGLDALNELNREDLRLQTEFAQKHREVVMGETAFKLEQIDLQAQAYRRAGADEVAVAQWANAEKLNLATDWTSGLERGLREAVDSGMNAAKAMEEVVGNAFQGMSNELTNSVLTGKASFSDFADSVIRDLTRMAMNRAIAGIFDMILGGLSGGGGGGGTSIFSLLMNEKGGAYNSPSLSAYSGGVYDTPQLFAFAHGAGVFGEAGPEAIMPLSRGADGVLGVRATTAAPKIIINQIEAPGRGGQVEQRQDDGVSVIDLFVDQIEGKLAMNVKQGRGSLNAAMTTTFGLNRSRGALR